jgi:hypothetical protein
MEFAGGSPMTVQLILLLFAVLAFFVGLVIGRSTKVDRKTNGQWMQSLYATCPFEHELDENGEPVERGTVRKEGRAA